MHSFALRLRRQGFIELLLPSLALSPTSVFSPSYTGRKWSTHCEALIISPFCPAKMKTALARVAEKQRKLSFETAINSNTTYTSFFNCHIPHSVSSVLFYFAMFPSAGIFISFDFMKLVNARPLLLLPRISCHQGAATRIECGKIQPKRGCCCGNKR